MAVTIVNTTEIVTVLNYLLSMPSLWIAGVLTSIRLQEVDSVLLARSS